MAGERILVVEDNEMNMKLFRDVLVATGYQTLEATTGAEAVELAAAHAPDLVLMDIQMPGIDGVQALHRLRADHRTAAIPVLAVTAQAMQGDRQGFLEAGFDGYVSKPVNVRELIGTVRQHCDERAPPEGHRGSAREHPARIVASSGSVGTEPGEAGVQGVDGQGCTSKQVRLPSHLVQ